MGKKRLDKAIELYKKVYPGGRNDKFTVSWHAFYLDPTAPKAGISWFERHEQRFGPGKAPARECFRKPPHPSPLISSTISSSIWCACYIYIIGSYPTLEAFLSGLWVLGALLRDPLQIEAMAADTKGDPPDQSKRD